MEKCENCGRTIGNLETPQIYNGHVVCQGCSAILASQQAPPPSRGVVVPPATFPSGKRGREARAFNRRRDAWATGQTQRFWARVILYGILAWALVAIAWAARQHNIDSILNR